MNAFSHLPCALSSCATLKYRIEEPFFNFFCRRWEGGDCGGEGGFSAVCNDHRYPEQWGNHTSVGGTPNNILMLDDICNYHSTPSTALHNRYSSQKRSKLQLQFSEQM